MTHIDENIQSKNYSPKSSLSYFHVEFQVSRSETVASARKLWEHRFSVPGLVSSTTLQAPTPSLHHHHHSLVKTMGNSWISQCLISFFEVSPTHLGIRTPWPLYCNTLCGVFVRYDENQSSVTPFRPFAICTSPIIHLVLPPTFCISFLFYFSWDHCNTQWK